MNINQIWTDDNYVYAATLSGLDVFSVSAETMYAYASYYTGFSAVWANEDSVFIGTTDSGVYYLSKSSISGSISNPYDITDQLSVYDFTNDLHSNDVVYIHGNDELIGVCSVSGIDIYKMGRNGYWSSTTCAGVKKCFMTSTGRFYYTISGISGWSLNRINSSLWDWVSPDQTWATGSGILAAGLKINDIFITEGTASDGSQNTVFIATTSGVYVIDESVEDCDIYFTIIASGV